jgi:hypothetical protein
MRITEEERKRMHCGSHAAAADLQGINSPKRWISNSQEVVAQEGRQAGSSLQRVRDGRPC